MRRLDRVLALLLGLALAGAAIIAGIEIMLLVLGQPSMVIPRSTWASALSTLQWDTTTLEIVSGAMLGAGVILLLLQLIPRRRVRLLLRRGAHAGTWLSRKGLNRKVAYDLAALAEVDKVSAKVGRRRVKVRVQLAPGIDATAGRTAVLAATDATLGHWPLLVPLRVSARVTTTALPTTPAPRVDGAGRATPARVS